jgi:hypothetical protein
MRKKTLRGTSEINRSTKAEEIQQTKEKSFLSFPKEYQSISELFSSQFQQF